MKLKLRFLAVKAVPKLFWSSPKALTIRPPIISAVVLIFGLILFGLGEALLIASSVGVSHWTVFAQGVTNVTGLSVCFATFLISICVLLLWIPLRQTPGFGTALNIIIIALVLDNSLPYLPEFEQLGLKIIEAIVGVMVTGFGGGLYLIANLGPGPRDGLMTGLQSKTNLPIAWVRSAIELTVVAVGWCLGGVLGVGTLLFAFGIWPSVAASLYGLQWAFGNETNKENTL